MSRNKNLRKTPTMPNATPAIITNEEVASSKVNEIVEQNTTSEQLQENTINAEQGTIEEIEKPVEKVIEVTPKEVPKLPKIIKKETPDEAHQSMLSEMKSELDRILKGMKPIKRMHFDNIVIYMDQMRPGKPVDPKIGSRNQISLMQSIKTILNSQDEDGDFQTSMIALLKLFEIGRKAALGEMYVFRFMEFVERPNDEISSFASSVNMLLVTCDNKSRKTTVRQIDFNKTLRYGFSEEARRRIMNFYDQ